MRAFAATMRIQMLNSLSRPMFRFTLFANPILYTLITYVMFQHSGMQDFASYVILGSSLLSLWSSIVFSSAGDIDRERYMGTLSMLYASPTSFQIIVWAKLCGNLMLAVLPFLSSFLIVRFVFMEPVVLSHAGLFFAAFLFSTASFAALSYLFSAFFTLSRKASILMNCLEYPIFLLCGILFPIQLLPAFLHPLSAVLSPTWASTLLHMALQKEYSTVVIMQSGGVLLLLTLLYVLLGRIIFYMVDIHVRKKGTLGVM